MHSNVCCGIYSQQLRYKSIPMNELINQWTSINGKMNIEVMIHTHENTNWNIFSDIGKILLKFIQNHKGSGVAKSILRKKYKAGALTLSDIKLHCKTTVMKTMWYRYKNRHEQRKRIEIPDIHPCIDDQLYIWTFDKSARNSQWRKDSLFNK